MKEISREDKARYFVSAPVLTHYILVRGLSLMTIRTSVLTHSPLGLVPMEVITKLREHARNFKLSSLFLISYHTKRSAQLKGDISQSAY